MIAFEWLGTMLQIFGAIGLASRLCSPREAYIVMLPGAVIWFGLSLYSHN